MRKSAQLSVRITEAEMTKLRELADGELVLLSVLIRSILAATAKEGGVTNLFGRLTAPLPGPEAGHSA